MVFRVYVEKREGLQNEASGLLEEIRNLLQIRSAKRLRLFNRYDVEGIEEPLFERAVKLVLSEPQLDIATRELPQELMLAAKKQKHTQAGVAAEAAAGAIPVKMAEDSGAAAQAEAASEAVQVFAVEYLPGQYDQRADSAAQCIQILSQGERPRVRTAKVYCLYGSVSAEELAKIKHYVINPVEAREASLAPAETLDIRYEIPTTVRRLDGFLGYSEEELSHFLTAEGLAMDLDDLKFCQQYFRSEHRDPTITEIKMIDTYWSDHCRHTTFLTTIDSAHFADEKVQQAFEHYQATRKKLGRTKPMNLMDIATLAVKELKAEGKLDKLDESEEINACTVKMTVDVDGKPEDWLLLFKNETHNHPTEIEPFGGAATCIGGAIRDPLSGRSYVYGAMRVTGAGDPTAPVSETIEGKLPQRKIVTTAAAGYSSYGNQIGLATGLVEELYHPGYVAKRLEIGAVIAAAPARNVRRERPEPGDRVILLGGRTGRDGIGGATGSSKAHNLESLEHCGAEVQKGNAPEERKLQRLFRNEEASRLIKRCNDFGAGGVSVAIGELADGLCIELDKVPKKYEGLDGTELAISESQERMAVVVAAEDVSRFLELSASENLEATEVAEVTEAARLVMHWNGQNIVDISREFLNSNGAEKHTDIAVEAPKAIRKDCPAKFAEGMKALAGDLNVCSKRGLSERFDATIGAGAVLMPFGGKYQRTPIQAMATKVSVEKQHTNLCSLMAYGYNPYVTEADPYRGSYLAVVESVSKLIAAGAGFEDVYLTFQEYFEKPGHVPSRWGQPLAALLGAFDAQLDLGIGAIGGKDSMSGSFEHLDVPPTLVSFAVTTEPVNHVLSPEFKAAGHRVLWLKPAVKDGLPTKESLLALFRVVAELAHAGKLCSIYTPGYGGAAEAVLKACMGNGFGFRFAESLSREDLFGYAYGSFLVELADGAEKAEQGSGASGEAEAADSLSAEETRRALYADARLQEAGAIVAELGQVTEEDGAVLSYNEETISLQELEAIYEDRLEDVFRCNMRKLSEEGTKVETGAKAEADAVAERTVKTEAAAEASGESHSGAAAAADAALPAFSFAAEQQATPSAANVAVLHGAKPRVLIPVFPGTNCEYDTAKAAADGGLEPDILVIRNLTAEGISASVREAARRITQSQIIFLPGGFSGGDEPDGSAKFITSFFRNVQVAEEVTKLLEVRDGLMAGICNGFQALIKLGLVPYGKLTEPDAKSPTLTYNTIGRHQSKIVQTRIASNLSPWLREVSVGDICNVAISHGEGRFLCDEAQALELAAKGQIATQYVDLSGRPSMDIQYNPNGSLFAIEGITSPDGRVFGKMGHSERIGDGLYRNVPGQYDLGMFRAARAYFMG